MSSSSDKKPGVLGRFLSQRGMGQVITVTIGLIRFMSGVWIYQS